MTTAETIPGAWSPADPARGAPPLRRGLPEPVLRLGLFVAYLAAVIVVAARHEMWRDEVRAWTLALQGHSVLSMIEGLRGEGHPIVWYALLRGGHALFGSPLVLPVLSAAIAAVAVWMVLRLAPFSLATKALFVFGVLPIFEYSVMSRNYGIGMLSIFVIAWHEPRRFEHPIRHGLLLFLLANTSAHAAIVAGGFLLAWIWGATVGGALRRPRTRRAISARAVALGMLLALAGIGLCVAMTYPERDGSITPVRQTGWGEVARAVGSALIHPGAPFRDLVLGGLVPHLPGTSSDRLFPALAAVLIVLAVVRFYRHRDLAVALAVTVVALHGFFRIVYPPTLRHVGLLFVMLLALEWIARERERRSRRPDPRRALFAVALTTVLVVHVAAGGVRWWEDYTQPLSSSKGLAAFLTAHPAYHDALIVSEPDYLVESLPYYAGNPLFSARLEQPFRWVRFSRGAEHLTLGRLLDVSDSLALRAPQPVLLVLGHPPTLSERRGQIDFSYDLSFTWTPEERERLLRDDPRIASFSARGDEAYSVFLVRPQ